MKIRKSLIILCYILVLGVCLWILHRIGLPEYGNHGSTETVELQDNKENSYDYEPSGGPMGEPSGDIMDLERVCQEMQELIQYIKCRYQEELLIQEARRRRAREAWEEAHRKWMWEQETVSEEQLYVPPEIMIASDLHFMSGTTHDNGAAFQNMIAEDDGKVSQYSDIIVDTLLQEVLEKRPSALILAGDNTLNGERINQEELAKKLQRLVDAGIPVLIIPGNHDIQNHSAATYFGDKREEAEYLETADDFLEIFHAFGYDQALSRDPSSLSYVYALDDTHWMMMLDSCQYENGNQVNGRIRSETLVWMREQLELAQEKKVSVVPVAHHNLLSESRLYTTECTMENHEEVIALLEEFELPVYFSGHLHAQRIKKHKVAPGMEENSYGITEIVMSPFSIPPCQYGSLTWNENGGMVFQTHTVDVASGYRKREAESTSETGNAPEPENASEAENVSGTENASEPGEMAESGKAAEPRNVPEADEPWGWNLELTEDDRDFLDNFSVRGEEFVKKIRRNQVEKTLYSAPADLKEQMSRLYANLYYDYCAGNRMTWDEVRTTKAFKLWERLYPDSTYVAEMRRMVEDVREDLHDWEKQY